MVGWTEDELTRIGCADELGISSRRADGSLRPYVTIWAVRSDGDIYVRSAYGPDNPWFARAIRSGIGRIAADGVECDVAFVAPAADVGPAITAAFHAKYDHYGPRLVGMVVSDEAVATTLRLEPQRGDGQ